jgi:hypothetical protein
MFFVDARVPLLIVFRAPLSLFLAGATFLIFRSLLFLFVFDLVVIYLFPGAEGRRARYRLAPRAVALSNRQANALALSTCHDKRKLFDLFLSRRLASAINE